MASIGYLLVLEYSHTTSLQANCVIILTVNITYMQEILLKSGPLKHTSTAAAQSLTFHKPTCVFIVTLIHEHQSRYHAMYAHDQQLTYCWLHYQRKHFITMLDYNDRSQCQHRVSHYYGCSSTIFHKTFPFNTHINAHQLHYFLKQLFTAAK